MPDFTVGKGDRYPVLTATLRSQLGTVIDLTDADSVAFLAQRVDGEGFTGAATITTAADGEVSYSLADGDTALPGLYRVEWVITWSTGITETVPTNRIATLEVV